MEITQKELINTDVWKLRPELVGAMWRMQAMTEMYNRCAKEDIWRFINMPGKLGKKYLQLEKAMKEVIKEEAKIITMQSE